MPAILPLKPTVAGIESAKLRASLISVAGLPNAVAVNVLSVLTDTINCMTFRSPFRKISLKIEKTRHFLFLYMRNRRTGTSFTYIIRFRENRVKNRLKKNLKNFPVRPVPFLRGQFLPFSVPFSPVSAVLDSPVR